MLGINNTTEYAAGLYPGYSQSGRKQFTLVVKSSLSIADDNTLKKIVAEDIVEQDEWRAEPNVSSLKAVAETMPFKQGAEILLQGNITPPHPHYHVLDINLSLQSEQHDWQKPLRLFGERVWQGNHLKATMSYPKSLQTLALSYEYAFGGQCPQKQKSYALNPAGCGYSVHHNKRSAVQLPQIEYQHRLLKHPWQKLKPAGYGPIPLQWAPRNCLADESMWQSLQHGKYPSDKSLPTNFYNVAPEDQQFAKPFTGGEKIGLQGLLPGVALAETITLEMPRLNPVCYVVSKHNQQKLNLNCDTYYIDLNQKKIHTLWRGAIIDDDSPLMDRHLLLTEVSPSE